jgi:hypothetical protein
MNLSRRRIERLLKKYGQTYSCSYVRRPGLLPQSSEPGFDGVISESEWEGYV